MEYGLIGEKLPHSFSKEIHEKLGYYQYSLEELWLNLKAGNIKNIIYSIANRIKKTIG